MMTTVKTVPNLADIPARMTVDEFRRLFGRVEHEQLDFKRGVPTDILDTIPAMAMTHGGLIVHGIDSRGRLTGCPFSQNTVDRITRFAGECEVEVQARPVRVGDRELTITAVPEVRKRIVSTPDGRVLRRVGGDCQPLRGDALSRFVRVRTEACGEEESVGTITPADLDLESVNQARAAEEQRPVEREEVPRALVDLGVARPAEPPLGPRILRAAVVLFAEDPRRFIPGAAVQLVRREGIGPGPGPSAAREEYAGPVCGVLDRCEKFVARHTRHYEAVAGRRREAIPEYPVAVVREALVNALAHRDYGLTGATVDLTIWDDRLEVQSPGPLPGHITPENMRREHYSRNRRIMRTLKTMGLVEEYGEGVDRMFAGMEARLMEPPIFLATSSSVTVTLRNRFLVSVEDQVWLSLLAHLRLSAAERQLLVTARSEGAVTRRRLGSLLPDTDIRQLLRGAVAKGLVVRIGERGGSRYELSDEIVLRAGSRSIEAESRKQQMLLDEIDQQGSISTVEAAELLGESVTAARQLLGDLAHSGQLRATGRTRARRYFRS